MLKKYLLIFLVSMVPLIELRGSIVMAVGMDLNFFTLWSVSSAICCRCPSSTFLPGRC